MGFLFYAILTFVVCYALLDCLRWLRGRRSAVLSTGDQHSGLLITSDAERAIKEAISQAQIESRSLAFKHDDLVSHPSCRRICKFRGIVGGQALLLDKHDGLIRVPANEIFDPLIARTAIRQHG